MVLPLNLNPISSPRQFKLLFNRNNQRSYGLKTSDSSVQRVIWTGTHLQVAGINYVAETSQPRYLDFAYDLLDRPQIVWKTITGEVKLYFYDTAIANYTTLNFGTIPDQPVIHNDYKLSGNNTILAYLKNQYPYYRLQSDRYTFEYLWKNRQYQGIKGLGYADGANTVSLILGYPPIPQG